MKQYLELLKDIKDNGFSHIDRTGTGRRSVYSRQLRFNLQEGFPLVTTREIFTKAMIHEMLWFIKGSTNNKLLNDNGVNIWNNWAVKEEDIDDFVNVKLKDFIDVYEEKELIILKQQIKEKALHNIGPMYGYCWRNAPNNDNVPPWKIKSIVEIASDKLIIFKEKYEEYLTTKHTNDNTTFEDFVMQYNEGTIDQLNDLILNLKERPYSARHIVTAWIPEFISYENESPAMNVLFGKGALAPCHAFFQCFVTPPEGDNKPKLSMMMYQR